MSDINLPKIGWQNGTLVSKAKVEIGGTIYEVEPEEYSGATPLSAENLIQMEENTEDTINTVFHILEGTTLYNNSTGARNITLSDSAENYDYFEIYDTGYNCHKIANPNGRNIDLSYLVIYPSGPTFRNFISTCTISGTSITLSNGYFFDHDGYISENSSFVIKKVVGYKY